MATDSVQRLEAELTSVRKRQHSDYSHAVKKGALNLVFQTLKIKGRLPCHTLQTMAEKTEIAIGTLKWWRRNLKSDTEWRSDPHRTGVGLKLPPEVEDRIATRIWTEFIARSLHCPPTFLYRLASFEATSLSMRDVEDVHDEAEKRAFKASRCWRRGFLKRHHFSARRFHVKKRSDPDDEIVSRFLNEWEAGKQQLPFHNILNADETSWRVLHNQMVTNTNTGADDV